MKTMTESTIIETLTNGNKLSTNDILTMYLMFDSEWFKELFDKYYDTSLWVLDNTLNQAVFRDMGLLTPQFIQNLKQTGCFGFVNPSPPDVVIEIGGFINNSLNAIQLNKKFSTMSVDEITAYHKHLLDTSVNDLLMMPWQVFIKSELLAHHVHKVSECYAPRKIQRSDISPTNLPYDYVSIEDSASILSSMISDMCETFSFVWVDGEPSQTDYLFDVKRKKITNILDVTIFPCDERINTMEYAKLVQCKLLAIYYDRQDWLSPDMLVELSRDGHIRDPKLAKKYGLIATLGGA